MRIGISKITKEYGIKTFQLHKWEERGWLGSEPILKDPDTNNQRMYSQEQVERIKFIHSVIEEQRKKGIKRTDFDEMEQLLLNQFGGEVIPIEKEVFEVLPSSVDGLQKMLMNQHKEIAKLVDMVANLQAREFPKPVDHSEEIEEIKTELQHSKEREEKLLSVIEKLQDDVDKLVQDKKSQNEKKNFISKLFGTTKAKRHGEI